MLRHTQVALKKGWTHNPGKTRRGVHPRRRPNNWQVQQFNLLGYTMWPKEIGFYNSGDNFELTPEASWRLYLKCRDEPFWGRLHSEKTIVHLLPKVEKNPSEEMERVNDVFRHHLKRFGADHYIYNAVMQACAFAKDLLRCEQLFREMEALGLEPNAQSFVNMMLAAKLAGHPREKCQEFFMEGVKRQALFAVLRVDTEFQMWMDQLDRLGSFTSESGYLSVNEEGAKPMPRDMWALWGWHRSESKFVSRDKAINEQVRGRVHAGRELIGTVYTKTRRQPWALYNGMLPFDYNGPQRHPPTQFVGAPAHGHESAGKAY